MLPSVQAAGCERIHGEESLREQLDSLSEAGKGQGELRAFLPGGLWEGSGGGPGGRRPCPPGRMRPCLGGLGGAEPRWKVAAGEVRGGWS